MNGPIGSELAGEGDGIGGGGRFSHRLVGERGVLSRQDAQAHQGCGATQPIVQGQKLQVRNERLRQHRGCEVDRIQRPYRLLREGPTGPVDDLRVQVEEDPVLDGRAEPGPALGRHRLFESVDRNSANQDAIALDESQGGAQDELGSGEQLTHVGPLGSPSSQARTALDSA